MGGILAITAVWLGYFLFPYNELKFMVKNVNMKAKVEFMVEQAVSRDSY